MDDRKMARGPSPSANALHLNVYPTTGPVSSASTKNRYLMACVHRSGEENGDRIGRGPSPIRSLVFYLPTMTLKGK
ncbi:hypothetical protein GWI33_017859 [Rhynchophorus ferrugineus]|uniref:Uncharacterized protein n=1 Tax=Rhynchophorus ferrugineus TaxID=354439 RepID=A0A834I1A4_RHYFE|nr:hypothetical protein GWI33_017859 [Rhynchophorus ferrugineus]